MNKNLVCDLPTRLLHWTLALSLSASLLIALTVDDESPLFQFHMLAGLVAVFAVIIRVVLGFVGSKHARFASFPLGLREVRRYFVGVFLGDHRMYAGNNPGSALAAVAMFLLVPAIVLSGLWMENGPAEELHELLAYALLAVIVAHLLGIAVHTLTRRDNIAASMITGRKSGAAEDAIPSARPALGIVLLLAMAAWVGALVGTHDAAAGTVRIPLLGTVLHLGESEGARNGGPDEREHQVSNRERSGHDDDWDD